MSSVTSIALLTSSYEGICPTVVRLSSWLSENEDGTALTRVDNFAIPGHKGLQCCIFLAAVNYLDREGFLAAFLSIEWEMPESVQLLLKGEHDDRFTVYTPCDDSRKPTTPQRASFWASLKRLLGELAKIKT